MRALRIQKARLGRRTAVLGGLVVGLVTPLFLLRMRSRRPGNPGNVKELALPGVTPAQAALAQPSRLTPASREQTTPSEQRTMPVNAANRQPATSSAWDYQSSGPARHSAHPRGRATAWAIVGMIIAATCVAGIGLILSMPWLFWMGLGGVALGAVFGRMTHAMRDQTLPEPGASRDGQPGAVPVV